MPINDPLNPAITVHTGRKKTSYDNNITMSIACREHNSITPDAITEHAQRRVDLFFYTLIAYYKTRLTVQIDETKLQHGVGTKQTAACHSAILPSLWDTQSANRRTSILDGTHFLQSMNSTVELHQSVNYFETHYLEGKKAQNKMRSKSLDILNRVSQSTITPVEGMLEFLTALNAHFNAIKENYLQKKELKTSPTHSRTLIFDCERKGSLQGNWHENAGTECPALNDDYVHTLLRLTPNDLETLKKHINETNEAYLERTNLAQKAIYEKSYHVIKQDMGLNGNGLPRSRPPERSDGVTERLVTQGFFAKPKGTLICERSIASVRNCI